MLPVILHMLRFDDVWCSFFPEGSLFVLGIFFLTIHVHLQVFACETSRTPGAVFGFFTMKVPFHHAVGVGISP